MYDNQNSSFMQKVCVVAGCGDSIVELRRNGALQRRISLPDDLLSTPICFNSFILILEVKGLCLMVDNANTSQLVCFSSHPVDIDSRVSVCY